MVEKDQSIWVRLAEASRSLKPLVLLEGERPSKILLAPTPKAEVTPTEAKKRRGRLFTYKPKS